MVSGGHARSGPAPDPNSLRSAQRGITFTALPAAGYRGHVPTFPLPAASTRELEVWWETWRTPQAAAWEKELWRHRSVAMWVRWSVRMEDEEASASLGNVVSRLADDIGLTSAGLKANGWKIVADEVAVKREEAAGPARESSRARLQVVNGGEGQ